MTATGAKRIFITGVSSGIGQALAEHYAAPGTTLGLLARRKEQLDAVARACETKGARVFAYPVDVTNRTAMAETARDFLAGAGGVDLVIANAGVTHYGDTLEKYLDGAAIARVFDVNLNGVVNTVVPFLEDALRNGRRPHLAAVGSVAGFRGLPNAGYSASKAGLKVLIDTWRLVFGPHGVRFTTICPGFVESEMTAGDRLAPIRMLPAARAAELIDRALARGTKTYVFPWFYRPAAWFLPWIPDALLRLGLRGRMRKLGH